MHPTIHTHAVLELVRARATLSGRYLLPKGVHIHQRVRRSDPSLERAGVAAHRNMAYLHLPAARTRIGDAVESRLLVLVAEQRRRDVASILGGGFQHLTHRGERRLGVIERLAFVVAPELRDDVAFHRWRSGCGSLQRVDDQILLRSRIRCQRPVTRHTHCSQWRRRIVL